MQATDPFPSAEAAWFWTAAVLAARRDPRACRAAAGDRRADGVVKCLDELYRHRRIELLHARILYLYGRRGRAPDPRRAGEGCDWRLWREAMEALGGRLRRGGWLVSPGRPFVSDGGAGAAPGAPPHR